MKTELLSNQIDKVAKECCTKMSTKEAKKYFIYQEQRQKTKILKLNGREIEIRDGYKSSYSSIRVYYKGKRMGQTRDVYHIDARLFLLLWKLVKPYIYKAAIYSNSNPTIVEENVAETKFLLFRVLRYFGPTPTGSKLSGYLKTIVNNVVTNEDNQKSRAKHRVSTTSESLTNVVDLDGTGANSGVSIESAYIVGKVKGEAMPCYNPNTGRRGYFKPARKERDNKGRAIKDEEGHDVWIPGEWNDEDPNDFVDNTAIIQDFINKVDVSCREIFFRASIPAHLEEPVNLLLSGCKLSEVVEECYFKDKAPKRGKGISEAEYAEKVKKFNRQKEKAKRGLKKELKAFLID